MHRKLYGYCHKYIFVFHRYAGQIGYLYAGMKYATEAQIGDTIYHPNRPVEPLPGFKLAKPMVRSC